MFASKAGWTRKKPRAHYVGVNRMNKFEIFTDSATIAVFDLKALEHRINDDGDWWTHEDFPELKEELNNQNLILINSGGDGKFTISVSESKEDSELKLKCPSGELFIVCGEEIPGEGLTPELLRGGIIYKVKPGIVGISYTQQDQYINVYIHG